MFRKILLYLCLVAADIAGASSLRVGLGFLSGNARNLPLVFAGVEKGWESSGFSWGIESGLAFQSGPAGVSLPLQGAIYYRFTQEDRNLVPSIGLSGGVVLSLGAGLSPVDALLLVHPSLDFLVSSNVRGFVRMSFGNRGATFQFAPLVGFSWVLDDELNPGAPAETSPGAPKKIFD